MFEIIKKLLFSRQLSFEEGEIKLLGQPVTMLPVELYIEMFNELKKTEPKKYRKIIYNITRGVGKTYSEILVKKYGMNAQKLAEWDVNTLELAGLGKCKVILYDVKNKKSILRVFNSIIAKILKPSKEPVDIFIAGYIAGSASVAFKSDKIECEEIACEAMGHPYCEFHVSEKK